MDFDASKALSGEKTVDELSDELFGLIADVCGGEITKSESLGHKEYCIPYKYQTSKVGEKEICEK
jgi:altronate dehydratase large subunit